MRNCLPILLLAAWSVSGGEIRSGTIHELMKSADIDATFVKIQDSLDVVMKPNFALVFRVSAGKAGAWRIPEDADELWVVRRGAAKLSVGESASGAKHYNIGAGDVVKVPRTKGYQIDPGAGRLEYVVIRTFPTERHLRGAEPAAGRGRGAALPGQGQGRGERGPQMDDVATKADIDNAIANSDRNLPLTSMGAFSMNIPIYKGAPGPYEAHASYDQIYFVRLGSAHAKLDGIIVDAREAQPGEIRGTGVTGAREYTMGVGDILVVPRNTPHFMDPVTNKYSYLLAHIRD
jgi:mannose-6-phosphate isomerase-like protein (cupin superfamily)